MQPLAQLIWLGPETLHHQQAPGTSAPRNTLEEAALTTTLCPQHTFAAALAPGGLCESLS